MPPLDLPLPGTRYLVMDHEADKAFGPYDSESAAKIAAFDLGREGYLLGSFDETSIIHLHPPVK